MSPKIISAEYVDDYVILVSFSDGISGKVNLENELWGDVFEPLKELAVFKKFQLDPELKTIVWSTGADFAPEFLYQQAAA